ncbi:MAG TPA: hypothetical protein VGA95_07485 [Thermodesulfobacteriota bacterium]
MFGFLEALVAFYGYITDKQYLECKNCGFLVEKRKVTKTKEMVECPKCGENEWEETSILDEEL